MERTTASKSTSVKVQGLGVFSFCSGRIWRCTATLGPRSAGIVYSFGLAKNAPSARTPSNVGCGYASSFYASIRPNVCVARLDVAPATSTRADRDPGKSVPANILPGHLLHHRVHLLAPYLFSSRDRSLRRYSPVLIHLCKLPHVLRFLFFWLGGRGVPPAATSATTNSLRCQMVPPHPWTDPGL